MIYSVKNRTYRILLFRSTIIAVVRGCIGIAECGMCGWTSEAVDWTSRRTEPRRVCVVGTSEFPKFRTNSGQRRRHHVAVAVLRLLARFIRFSNYLSVKDLVSHFWQGKSPDWSTKIEIVSLFYFVSFIISIWLVLVIKINSHSEWNCFSTVLNRTLDRI